MLQLRQAPLRRFEPGGGWQSPVTIPRRWLAALFVGCTLFAIGMGVFSSNGLHRLWGLFAAGAYVLAAAVVLAWRSARSVDLALILSIGGALIAPLAVLAEQGRWQPEVGVIARGARLMVHHGSPYLSDAVVHATHDPNIYNPYLPVMAIFGIPRALFGPGLLTDPRVWFCLGFVVLFAAALAVAGARDVVRWTVLVTATPVIAFSLTVGGTDVPVLALICLGLALLWQHPRPLLAGAVLGIAAATKATAWPALVVAGTMVLVRDGRRTAARFSATAVVVACAIIVPVAAARHARAGGQHDPVPARPGQRQVGGGQPAARARPRGYRAYRAPDRGDAARPGRAGRAGLAGGPATADRARRHLAAHHRPGADVHPGPGDPVRLLHVPARAMGLADRVPARVAAQPEISPGVA